MTMIASARGESSRISSKPLTHLSLTWAPETVRKGGRTLKVDMFRHTISSSDGLPPYAQARIIDLISTQLKKHRYSPCLWVTVDAPGTWYLDEVKRLVRYNIPITILTPEQDLTMLVTGINPDGDLAPWGQPDGELNAADLLIMRRIVLGEIVAEPLDLLHGDLYPPGAPDGVINMSDLILQQKLILQAGGA